MQKPMPLKMKEGVGSNHIGSGYKSLGIIGSGSYG